MKKINEYDYIVTPYPEKIARFLNVNYVLFWLFISCIIFLSQIVDCWIVNKPINSLWDIKLSCFIGTLGIFSFLSAFIALAIIGLSKELERFTPTLSLFINWPDDKILEWYTAEIRAIFRFKWMVLFGVVLASVLWASIAFTALCKNFKLHQDIVFGIMILLMGFLGGGLFYSMIRTAWMIHKMGDIKDIKVSIYQHPLTSIKAVGTLLRKIAMIIILMYLMGILGITLEDGLLGPPIVALAAFFGFVVLAFFVFPQFKIHKIMAKVKHVRIRKFSLYLEESLENVLGDPSRDNIQRVRELFEIQKSLNEMNEWPFNTKMIAILLTTVAIPLAITVLQLFCKWL